MQIPSRAELERFFDESQAKEVQFIETVASWPSLRVLGFLYENDAASTGDIARELNMDMREVKDRLDALESEGIVEDADGAWRPATDEITITLRGKDGLELSHALGTGSGSEPTEERPEGIISRLGRAITAPFR